MASIFGRVAEVKVRVGLFFISITVKSNLAPNPVCHCPQIVGRQSGEITDDGGLNVDFVFHDSRLGSENCGLSPVIIVPLKSS